MRLILYRLKTKSATEPPTKGQILLTHFLFLALTRVLRNLAANCVQSKSLKTRNQSHQKRKNSFYASFLCWLEFSETFQQMSELKSGESGRQVIWQIQTIQADFEKKFRFNFSQVHSFILIPTTLGVSFVGMRRSTCLISILKTP